MTQNNWGQIEEEQVPLAKERRADNKMKALNVRLKSESIEEISRACTDKVNNVK